MIFYLKFKGTGASGDMLQDLCNVERNNYDSPDMRDDWEIKFHGGNSSLLTLFHKDPQPAGVIDKLVDVFGWPNKELELFEAIETGVIR